MKTNPIIPIPIHFKKPGRSYSQIGRKGNVALYSVYSDYFLLHGFQLPYLLIGFELICIKVKDGVERYPRDSEFGRCAWAIPKSLKSLGRIRSRLCRSESQSARWPALASVPDRSATPEESASVASTEFVES